MKAVDSLHVAVHLIVPSGVSFCCSSPCRRACSAGAFAPHFALPSLHPKNMEALFLEKKKNLEQRTNNLGAFRNMGALFWKKTALSNVPTS